MKIGINTKDTNRAHAFGLWMSSPMPMVTLVKTIDVTLLVSEYGKDGADAKLVILKRR